MAADFHHIRYGFKLDCRVYGALMSTLQTALGFDLSDKAKFRYHVLSVFYRSGWKAVNLAFPNLSRATVYRWKKKYEASFKQLNSLVPKSTRPVNTRRMMTPVKILRFIKSLLGVYPRMGKVKVKLFLDEFCELEGLSAVAVSTVGKIIKRNNFFFSGKENLRKRTIPSSKSRVSRCPSPEALTPGYLQLDGIKFSSFGKYYYFLTAVEIVTRQAYVFLVPALSSKQAAIFLRDILTKIPIRIHTIQTDNGGEFELYFEEAIRESGLTHLYSYPHSPKTNGFVERFNWTVKDEFLYEYEDGLDDKEEFQKRLADWVVYYNTVRPHQPLGYKTPNQYLQERTDCLKSM